MNQYAAQTRMDKFSSMLESYLKDMRKLKAENPNVWKQEYDDLYNELNNILLIHDNNPYESNKMFNSTIISKYDSFINYVYNNDVGSIAELKGSNERTKTLRAKRKDVNCPLCGYSLTTNSGTIYCANCGYTNDVSVTNSVRITSNNMKHIYKQLDALTGVRKAPCNIEKIIDYISIWLTDLQFIYCWLSSNNGKRLGQWISKYNELTDDIITVEFFDRKIERVPDNMFDYNVFKLFTDELYLMLEYATRYANENDSNMQLLPDERVIEIYQEFVMHNHRLPTIVDKITIDGVIYEIGLHANTLSLLYDVPQDHVKRKLERMFNTSLTHPGLMFNYKQVYKKSENPPKKYCYQQEYCWITNRTFHTEFITMPKRDKEAIVMIITKFNEYYKEQTYIKQDKGCNSPLYCCTIACVINLPYFRKYAELLRFIPVKDKNTVSHIRREFFNFETANQEMLEPFQHENATLVEDLVIEKKKPKRKSSPAKDKPTRKRKASPAKQKRSTHASDNENDGVTIDEQDDVLSMRFDNDNWLNDTIVSDGIYDDNVVGTTGSDNSDSF